MEWGSFTYLFYLLLALIGTFALQFFFKIQIALREAMIAIFVSGVFFILWDTWAAYAGHWSFGMQLMLGPMLGNQPLEEILFFIVIPLFGLTVWELFAEKRRAP